MSERPLARQFPTALEFAVRNQARNRFAWLLLALFVPAWYALMAALIPHDPLDFKLFSTGDFLHVDGRHLGLVTAGMNSLTLVVGFAVFAAIRRALPLDKRLVFAGYRQSLLVAAKSIATLAVGATVGLYGTVVLLAFWRPSLSGWFAILVSFALMAAVYGALGLMLGVLVKGDLEGFFLIIMGGLTDTFLQNPVGNPVANKPVLQYFPSFGPMQFATGGAFGDTWLWSDLAVGAAWALAFAAIGLVVFQVRTRNRRSPAADGGTPQPANAV